MNCLSTGTHGTDLPAAHTASHGIAALADPHIHRIYVNEVYPRLLYICSNVYCFMFGAGMKQRQKWVDFIENHASQAAAGIVNQRVLPVLIIVFNMTTVEDGIWDTKKATEEAQIKDLVKLYFNDVHVVCIHQFFENFVRQL
jgi:hypothetical protein